MKPEEAIEMFERVKKGNIYLVHQRVIGKEVYEDYSLVDMAIDALKKQIPVKPDEHLEQVQKHMNLGVKAPFCPKCGSDLLDEKNDCYNFCPYCGQAIDWSECNGTDGQN